MATVSVYACALSCCSLPTAQVEDILSLLRYVVLCCVASRRSGGRAGWPGDGCVGVVRQVRKHGAERGRLSEALVVLWIACWADGDGEGGVCLLG